MKTCSECRLWLNEEQGRGWHNGTCSNPEVTQRVSEDCFEGGELRTSADFGCIFIEPKA